MYKELVIGISVYLTKAMGIGGKLKKDAEDFIVTELSLRPEEKEDGYYTAAVIRSKNWETNRLIRRLARNLRISRKKIYFAGTKDKRAIATQLFVFSTPLEDVLALRIPDVEVLEAYRTDKRIMLGDLIGNEFHIAIRDINLSNNEVEKRIESTRNEVLAIGGFPNFFGVQRFGAVRPVTHLVGKHIVRGEFKNAVDTYVANPIEGENKEEFEARKALEESGDCAEALRNYPKNLSFEKAILNYLVKNEDDYVGALNELPLNLLMMFVHSYQSYLYNIIISERIKRGMPLNKPLLGDIVLPINKLGLPDHERWINVGKENIEKLGIRCREGKAFVSGILFGSEVEFARSEMGKIEKGIVDKEGLKPEDFIIPRMPRISSRGIRRELLAPINKLDYEIFDDKVLLKFQLTKGCYATSLLRELMKSEEIVNY